MQFTYKPKQDLIRDGNTNFYTLPYEQFNTFYMNEAEKKRKEEYDKQAYVLPLVNFTSIKDNFEKNKAKNGLKQDAYLFPRWTALTRATNPKNSNLRTSSLMVAGVTICLIQKFRIKYWKGILVWQLVFQILA